MAGQHPLADDDSDEFYAQLQQAAAAAEPLTSQQQAAADDAGVHGLRQLASRVGSIRWEAFASCAQTAEGFGR